MLWVYRVSRVAPSQCFFFGPPFGFSCSLNFCPALRRSTRNCQPTPPRLIHLWINDSIIGGTCQRFKHRWLARWLAQSPQLELASGAAAAAAALGVTVCVPVCVQSMQGPTTCLAVFPSWRDINDHPTVSHWPFASWPRLNLKLSCLLCVVCGTVSIPTAGVRSLLQGS